MSAVAQRPVKASEYNAVETLRDGRRVTIRAQRPQDREPLLDALARTGDESRYRRFFGPKRALTEDEIARFTDVDFEKHVALVAEPPDPERAVIAGAGRYIASRSGRAEVAFMVGDEYQGLGIGSLLMRHLVAIARAAGLEALEAEVLADNTAMLKVFERAGLAMKTRREGGVLHLELALAPPNSPARSKS